MASNLYDVMTWEKACQVFEESILPELVEQETEWQGGVWEHADKPLRCETWNNWTDSLCKNKQISDWQYSNWSQPECCEG